jgi:HEAT repeat protein
MLGDHSPDDRAVNAAVAALSDPSEEVRTAAETQLNNNFVHHARLPELLAEQLKAHAPDPSNNLVSAIRRLRSKDAMPLLEGLWKTAPKHHALVLQVMLDVDSDEANAFLVQHFDELPEYARGRAIERFGKAVYEPAIDVIGSQLASRDAAIRAKAQAALAIFKKQREAVEEFKRWKTGSAESRASIIELTKLLESTNKDVVIGAVRALGAVRAQSALPALVKLLDRNDPALKEAVDAAIRKIGE